MTPAERRAQMPESSAMWDAYVAEFGLPLWFRAEENGERINYSQVNRAERSKEE